MLTTFAAFFAFGYCVSDIIINTIQRRKMDQLFKDIDGVNQLDNLYRNSGHNQQD